MNVHAERHRREDRAEKHGLAGFGRIYVLTGENSSYTDVVPNNNFDFANGTWGAFEVTARYSDLRIDDNAFPIFASASTNADEAKALGVGLNWYLSKAVVFKIDYYQTKFGFNGGANFRFGDANSPPG